MLGELDAQRAEFEQYREAGQYEGQVLPRQQLSDMRERFDRLPASTDVIGRQLACDELRYMVLAVLEVAEPKAQAWTEKKGYLRDVAAQLNDYQVQALRCVRVVV